MRVSVHICTRDRESYLGICLVSLLNQTFTDWDLVLVDGNQIPLISNKMIHDILYRIRSEGHETIIIRDELNLGVCQARNLAIKADITNNPLICRIDEDSVIDQDYLEELATMIQNNKDLGAISGVVPLYGSEKIFRQLPDEFNKITFDSEGNIDIKDDAYCLYKGGTRDASHLRSSFMFRREVLDKIKEEFGNYGFDEDLGQVGFREETKFCMKAAWCGYKMAVNTSAICWHIHAPSGGTRRENYIQQVQTADEHFRRWVRWNFKQRGSPYKN